MTATFPVRINRLGEIGNLLQQLKQSEMT